MGGVTGPKSVVSLRKVGQKRGPGLEDTEWKSSVFLRVFLKVTHMPLAFELKELWRELEDSNPMCMLVRLNWLQLGRLAATCVSVQAEHSIVRPHQGQMMAIPGPHYVVSAGHTGNQEQAVGLFQVNCCSVRCATSKKDMA